MQLACFEFMSKLDSKFALISKTRFCHQHQRATYSFPQLKSIVCNKQTSRSILNTWQRSDDLKA